jgi:segregation and condensation protein B
MTDEHRVKHIVESVLMAAGKPLSLDQLLEVFDDGETTLERDELRAALAALQEDYSERGIELVEVGSGFRIQVSQRMEPWVSRLTEEKPARYSRALLETLALVAYRQPITRGEIEDIRGVSVSSSIMKTLQEREWVRVIGHRDVPGRPAMYGTTRQFLDYFNLKGLDDLPTLMELRDFDTINAELDLTLPGEKRPLDGAADGEVVDSAGSAEDQDGDMPVAPAVAVQIPVDGADGKGTLH